MSLATICTCGYSISGTCLSSIKQCKKLNLEDLSAPASPVEESVLEMGLQFQNHGDAMTIQCPDEEGEFAIMVKSKGARHWQGYSFDNEEAEEIASFLFRHVANAESKPSPVIEIGEQGGEIPQDFRAWINETMPRKELSETTPEIVANQMGYVNGAQSAYRKLTEKRADICSNEDFKEAANNAYFAISTVTDARTSDAYMEGFLAGKESTLTESPTSHPAPAPIVGEREKDQWHPQDYSGKNAPTEQAIPDDIAAFILSISKGAGGDCYIITACEKLYHKMKEEIKELQRRKSIALDIHSAEIDQMQSELSAAHSLIKDLQAIL